MNVEVLQGFAGLQAERHRPPPSRKTITWGPGTTWYWSALVFPKVEFCAWRLDKRDGHSYKLFAVKPWR